jgi:DNA/RNA endonuclease G (NUC1)
MYVRYEVIGANSVAVPTHFFKVIVAETADQKYDMEAYVMPNQVIDDSTPLTVFQVCGTQLRLCKLSGSDTSYVLCTYMIIILYDNYLLPLPVGSCIVLT